MASLVQRIARQARATYRSPPRPGEAPPAAYLDDHHRLWALVAQVRAADLQLVPRRADGRPAGGHAPPCVRGAPPVTYMHICETERFSMGVFLLRGGASIPLHDHPGMHGMLKVMYGTLRISCFDRPEPGGAPGAGPGGGPGGGPGPALRRSVLRSSGEYTEHSGPCVLSPDRDNLHQIDAVDGPSAFLDILAPPYDPDHGRDCHYYRVLGAPAGAPGGVPAGPGGLGPGAPLRDHEVWLLEVSQPPEFWCGGEPYPGPEVRL